MIASSVDLPAPLAPTSPSREPSGNLEVDAAEGVDRHRRGGLSANGLDHATLQVVVEDRQQLVLGANVAEADLSHHATQYGSRERARVNTASPTATLITVTIAEPT